MPTEQWGLHARELELHAYSTAPEGLTHIYLFLYLLQYRQGPAPVAVSIYTAAFG